MSEEEDEVIKPKENVVTRTNEQRLTRNILRLDLLIFRRASVLEELSVWRRRGERSSFKLVLDQLVKEITHGGGLQ